MNYHGNMATDGMVVTPHHLASQSALSILKEGGSAMEAAVAAAATIAVVYPHMNSIGGDGFWLIVPPHDEPFVIEACGAAGSFANEEFYKDLDTIPFRGPKSANTVAGAIGGWNEVLNYVEECGYQKISLSRLLSDAIKYAEKGYPISAKELEDLKSFIEGDQKVSNFFKNIFMPEGKLPSVGQIFCQKELANTFKVLVENGLNSFYSGDLSQSIAEDMKMLGMPITLNDLKNYKTIRRKPLRLLHKFGEIFNTPPPTQGLVSLSVLGILDKLGIDGKHEGDFIHATVEATKEGFNLRDSYITDPNWMKIDSQSLLSDHAISDMAKNISLKKVTKTAKGKGPGDTIWLGVMDKKGFSVSYIQSTYHTFGSGVVLPKSGILWHNRGVSFSLNKKDLLFIQPGKKPFHTLNPAAAKLHDGRILIYGTRGGDGQAQTQAAIFHRYVVQNLGLQKAVSDPRWLFGSISGTRSDDLKIESRFSEETIKNLKEKGHKIVVTSSYSEMMGHAGMLVRHPNGALEGAFDPRSDGSACGF